MEPIHIHTGQKTAKFAPEDVISRMPNIVITNILDRLPLQDAVRTGVLSRNWRFKWTMLSQLVFDDNFFNYLLERKVNYDHVRIIDRILLHLRGAITKFVLSIYDPGSDAEHINHWILFLSRKGIKDLTLENIAQTPLMLSTHLFSCLELTHMKLFNCCFDLPFSFLGFPNLLSLELSQDYESIELGEFFTRRPLIEILKYAILSGIGSIKLVEITKLENLKILSLSLRDLDHEITNSSTIFELLGSFPKLQELDLNFAFCELTEGGAKGRFPTAFPCLKALKLSNIELGNDIMLFCTLELIRCTPNLQTLEIKAIARDADPPLAIPEEAYNTMGPLQLQSVVFRNLKGSHDEVYLIKYLLVCSPFLKKFVIHHYLSLALGEKLFTRKLLKLQRAYPLVDIDYYEF